jgi:hypothetical protein
MSGGRGFRRHDRGAPADPDVPTVEGMAEWNRAYSEKIAGTRPARP